MEITEKVVCPTCLDATTRRLVLADMGDVVIAPVEVVWCRNGHEIAASTVGDGPCQSVKDFWVSIHGDGCVFRTAVRKEHECGHCRRIIAIGERYLDTGETVGQWATAKVCPGCAHAPVAA